MAVALSLVMPMAGRGSRFVRTGRSTPKPLIDVAGQPAFVWAVESVRQATPVGEMVFVVLDEHVREHAIDTAILSHYPAARIVALDAVTGGAAETAALGVAALTGDGPVAVNDCDHAFQATDLPALVKGLKAGAAGALIGFTSNSPAYSYVRLNADGEVAQTAEKQVIGTYAIAGCYLFADAGGFRRRFDAYRRDCPYAELFVSGLYDAMARADERVLFQPLKRHVSFGAPDELDRVRASDLAFLRRPLPRVEAKARGGATAALHRGVEPTAAVVTRN
jgi:2-C-methyl-D-erythritol 4-phosphate cytidylyltransferase